MAIIITDPDNIIEGDDVTTNTTTRRITINAGTGTNLPAAADGIAEQALYSWYKEEWKDVANRSRYPFLFDAITPEQMEMRKGWQHSSTTSEKSVRTGGWRYIDTDNGNSIVKEFMGAVSLGTFEDSANDTAYYVLGNDPTDTGAAVDFDFPGPVNEPILVYENLGNPDTCNFATSSTITRATGSFITDGYAVGGQVTVINSASNDGTYVITGVAALTLTVTGTPFTTGLDAAAELAVNNRNAVTLFLRERDADPNGKTFSKSTLSDIGVTEVDNKVFRFPLSNATDLKIAETDANISTQSPWTEVRLRYLGATYNREVDSVTKRDFGIIIDVGTYSQANGASATSTLFTSAALNLGAGEALADYTGGTLTIHEGTDQGIHTIVGTPVDNAGTLEITLSVALTATESNLSFTMERATPVTATAEEIYEKVQYQLRQAADIDESGTGIVTGRTADPILTFVGDELRAGEATNRVNPNGGGTGVIIEGFDSNDTNRIKFYDNTGTQRAFPFVAAGNILVNANAVADTGPAEYVMYFEYTERFTNVGFGISGVAAQVATLDSSTTDLTAELTLGDFIKLDGFTNEENNGYWEVTGAPAGAGPYTAQITKRFNADAPVNEAAGASVSLAKNPIDTDDAIVVNNNAGSPITGTVGGLSIPFDFDYDNNVQGGRTAGTPAVVIVRVLGTDTAVNAEGSGTISASTGISISVSNPLERNYLNPL